MVPTYIDADDDHAPSPPIKPVSVNQVLLQRKITEISKRRGDGIIREKGLVIFIPNVELGEIVDVLIKYVGYNSAEGERIDVK